MLSILNIHWRIYQHDQDSYLKSLMNKNESFFRRIRWKAYKCGSQKYDLCLAEKVAITR